MKKRVKGLLVLWLAFLMVVSTPMTAYAAISNIILYDGTEPLNANLYYGYDDKYKDKFKVLFADPSEDGKTPALEAFAEGKKTLIKTLVGDNLSTQTGYTHVGWRLWNSTSGYSLSNPSDIKDETYGIEVPASDSETYSSSEYVKYIAGEGLELMAIEPVWELDYKITHQPDNVKPYVEINDAGKDKVSKYEWFSATEYSVVDKVRIFNNVGNYYADSSTWKGINNTENTDGTSSYLLNLYIGNLTPGDTLLITPIENTNIEMKPDNDIFSFSKNAEGVWSGTIKSADNFVLNITSVAPISVKISGLRVETTPVEGQDQPTFSGENGEYFCKVSFQNGATLTSNRFTYTRYAITAKEPTDYGSYSFQVNGVDVTKAASGDVVTVKANPNAGYKLDTITVIKADDSNTSVNVENDSFTMPDYPVTVEVTFKLSTYQITLPQEQRGYSVTSSQTSPVKHGSDYTFTVTINEGYAATNNYVVKANEKELVATEEGGYTYTIEGVTANQEITVSGVEDVKKPSIWIKLNDEYCGTSFSPNITFDKYLNTNDKSISIIASDNQVNSPTLMYYMADTNLFPVKDKVYTADEIGATIKEWTEYSKAIILAEDGTYVLYAKATDDAGNVEYANTTGIVVDTKTPVISDIQNNDVYYGDTSFKVNDDNLDVVTVDGSSVQPDGGSYKVTADNASHTVVATDKAGNSVTYEITVYKQYAITLPEETVGYRIESSQTSPINHESAYNFKITINEGYVAPKGLEVRANDVLLTGQITSDGSYTYTIEKVVAAQNITVTGVEETYTITKPATDGGSYIVKANNSEVSTAVKDTVVTIEVTPAEGYELDTVTVVKTDNSSTAVEVVNNSFTMPSYPVTVNVTFKKLTYTITIPPEAEGYTVKSDQASSVEHGDSYAFTVTIREGYVASADFEVQANSAKLTATKTGDTVYSFEIKNVTSEQIVTVSGVKDGTAPVIKITLDENNWWQNFLNAISFGLFFKEEKSLTITATDNVSTTPSIMYHIANADLFPEEGIYSAVAIEQIISVWTPYTGQISLSNNGKYVVYAKATDEAGNVSYASTTGIVVDTKTPDISGIQNNGVYYGDVSFTVSDDYLDTVKIDNAVEQPVEGSFKITADNKSHTVVATDKAGNSVVYTITVYKQYDITLPGETVSYKVESDQTSTVNHGSDYSFTVTLKEEYAASDSFAVKANNSALKATNVSGNVYSFTIKNVTEAQSITITGVELKKYGITKTETTGGSFTVKANNSEVSTAVKDTVITIGVTPAVGYELDKITVKQMDGSDTAVTVDDKNQFTMPGYPVTVKVTFKKLTYTITLPPEAEGYTVKSDQTSTVDHGGDYSFTVTLKEEYTASDNFAVKANNSALKATNVSGNVYSFTIKNVTEAQSITITGVELKKYGITKTETTGGSFTVTAGSSAVIEAIKGTSITITSTPADGYELDAVTVVKTDDSSTAVEVVSNSFTMPSYPVTVNVIFKKLSYTITLPPEAEGYTVTSEQASPVEHGSNYTFKLTINKGYVASKDFEVQANGTKLTATETGNNVYTYRLEKVTSNQKVTVSGVVDGEAPTITIALDEDMRWQNFLNAISFGLFFKEEKSLTITATDNVSTTPAKMYHMANADLFPEEGIYSAAAIEQIISVWTPYTGQISLSNNGKYVVYAKATDEAGNVSYASTTGIVVDTKTPDISGIQNNGVYYGDVSFTVSDDYLDTVMIDNVIAQPVEGSYKITADNNSHTVVAMDKAGNSVSYEIEVYKQYDITLPEEAVGYTVESTQTTPVNHGSDYSFTVTLKEEYAASDSFAVKANDSTLTATNVSGNVYTFTIKNVTEAQSITIIGVELKKYGITKSETTGGSFTVTAGSSAVTEANKGTSITITSTPADGYELDTVTVVKTDDSSTAVEVVSNSFTMPSYPVTVKVTFKKLTYAVTLPTETVSYKVESDQISPVNHGSDYSFTVTLKEEYVASDSFAVKANDSTLTETNVSGNVYTFTIKNVTEAQSITITGVELKKYGITKSETTGGNFTVKANNSEVSTAVKDTVVTIEVTPAEGYELDTVTVVKTDDSSTAVEVVSNSFTMPSYPVTVKVTFKKLTYTITLPPEAEGYTVTSDQTSSVGHGDSYSFTVAILDDYKATEKYAVQVKDKVIEPIEYGINAYYYTIDSVTEPLSISVIGVKKLHEIAISETVNGSYTVTAEDESNVTTAVMDTKLTITPSPAEGYELDKISVIQKDGESTAVAVDDKNQFTMPDYPVSIDVTFKKKTYGVTLPQGQTGYTVTSSQTATVEHGNDYTFKVTVSEGYDVPTVLSVKANGNELAATSVNGKEYTYTIQKVVTAQEITVVGVSDITGPEVTITLDEKNTWKNFLIKIGFGLFFKVEKNLTITAADAGSGIGSVTYYVSETDLFPEDDTYSAEEIEKRIPRWTEYTDAVPISVDRSYVVYAKATDEAGNVSYVSTSGIVIDTTAPVISGLKDGEVYYGDTSATVSDDNLSTVKLDGKEVEFTGTTASVTIFADSEEHTIEVTDKAGNQTTYQVGVYETWVRDGISTGGSRSLKSGVPYKFGSGKWKVSGDATVYEGGNTFYASEGGTFEFQNQ